MVNVQSNFKLINIELDGKKYTVQIDTKEAWNVFEFDFDGKSFTVNEGDEIEFVTDSGEIKTGTIIKVTGKGEKTKIKMNPSGQSCEEIWSVMSINEGTLKVLGAEDTEDDDE